MMKEKKIYILLTDTGTLFTRLIKIFTIIMHQYPLMLNYQRYIALDGKK